MPRTKVNYLPNEQEVVYDEIRWEVFRQKREEAIKICQPLHERGLPIIVYGSTARGDVKPSSDLDILIDGMIPSYQVEMALEVSGLQLVGKEIVQATPGDVIKGHLYLSDETCITIFLTSPKDISNQFYRFGGWVVYDELVKLVRKPGVNKSLTLILPTEKGHKEMNLIGNEKYAADTLGITPKIIEARVRVLTKRDKVGRTGIFMREMIDLDQSLEEQLQRLADENPIVKKKVLES
jgi:predicted nucleotidyltransferase